MESNLDALVKQIGGLSVFDLSKLVGLIEKEFGVSAAMQVATAAVAEAPAEKAEEKSSYKVTLKEVGDKLKAIKAVRSVVANLGLSEAKALVEGAPSVIAEAASKDDAMKMKAALEEAGAKVELA